MSELTRIELGAGQVVLSATTGAPRQFTDPDAPERRFLLDDASPWHSLEHEWGSGFVIGQQASARWGTPHEFEQHAGGSRAVHRLAGDLELTVTRDWSGEQLVERFTFTNRSSQSQRLDTIGIQVPIADVYENATSALATSVHAHVWTGGTWSWLLAQPMSGLGRSLGLVVTRGSLQAYSVESRNPNTLSNARGHLVLHPSDAARNPEAFGGQQPIALEPGQEWVLEWRLGWYDDVEAFIAGTGAPAVLPRLAATVGDALEVVSASAVTSATLQVTDTGDGAQLRATTTGLHGVRLGDGARTEVLFHAPVTTVVEDRARFILERQRTTERPGTLSHAIAPFDNGTGLTQLTDNWSDWSDGSERIGMAVLLQQARRRGLVSDDAEAALDGWAAFACDHLLDDTAAPRRGSQDHHTGIRLYDSPWLALFFAQRARGIAADRPDDAASALDLAARILERAFALGAERFLAILFAEAVELVAADLDLAEQGERADALRQQLVAGARHYVDAGTDLPAHEVAYEQSMVAPLVSMLAAAHRISGDAAFLPAIAERVDWLLAFGGPQPHARLRDVAIRHWDGYWFGRLRLWGDVFPHYWSTLTAVALLQLPEPLRTAERTERAQAILHANMAGFGDDGWATCAFVMPSAVDGRPAHIADPLANDQDWHLVMWMLLEEQGLASLN